jgi:PAS domain S-box-containing protein
MNEDKRHSADQRKLRKEAEKSLAKKKIEKSGELSEFESMKLLHELQVHQIELEMQNEELTHSKAKAELASKRIAELFDIAPVGIYETDPEGRCLRVNKLWCKFAGLTPQEALGDGWKQALHPADREHIFNLWVEHAHQMKPWNYEYRFCTPDNVVTWVWGTTIPMFDEHGKLSGYLGINTDITSRIQAEEELKSNYSLLRIAGKTAKFGGWIHDFSKNKGIWSDEVSNIHETPAGYLPSLEEGINFYAPEWRETISKAVADCVEKGIPYDLELEIITAKNNRIWVRTAGEAVRKKNGKITKIRGSFQDISQRKKIENDLRLAEERYRIVAENTYNWEFWEGPEGQYLYHSPSCKRISGYEVNDFISDPEMLLKIIHPEDRNDYENHIHLLKTELKPRSVEFRIINANGAVNWIEQICQPVYSNDGIFLGIRGSNREVTQRKLKNSVNVSRLHLVQFAQTHTLDELLEETLNEAEKLTGSKIGFFHFVDDNQENLTLQNWSANTKAIFCKADGKGTHYPVSRAGVWVDCLKQREPVIHNDYASLTNRKGLPEGHAEVLRELVVPIIRNEKIKGILGVGNKVTDYIQQDIDIVSMLADQAWDIAELKKTEDELIKSEAKFRELNATKDKFFSIIAHDLKNPFNAIMGFSNLLSERIKEKDYHRIEKYVEYIQSASQIAVDLLGNLLEWTRSQTGRIAFNPDYTELVALINEVINLLEASAVQKSIHIVRKLPVEATVIIDSEMISTVLRNLISNAIKFTRQGGEIVISLELNDEELKVTVADDGVGIKKEALGKLFKIDEGYSTKGTNSEIGTGLGLILCKEFVDKHNGKIWAESDVNKGSFFYFTLPLNKTNKEHS